MGMVTQEFEMSEVLKNSNNDILKEYTTGEFVAIYEEADNENFNLEQYLTETLDRKKTNKEVVIITKKDWNAIKAMMLRNYDIKKRRGGLTMENNELAEKIKLLHEAINNIGSYGFSSEEAAYANGYEAGIERAIDILENND